MCSISCGGEGDAEHVVFLNQLYFDVMERVETNSH